MGEESIAREGQDLGGGRSPRVLLVDDSVDSREMFARTLSLAGWDVDVAESAAAALEAAARVKFDLVISDIGMPEMSGYDLAIALRSIPTYRAVPLIAVTGFAEFSDRHTSVWAGFDEHLSKPVDPARLLEIAARLIGTGG